LRLGAFASEKKKTAKNIETRSKKPVCRQAGKILEARPSERLDFFAPSRLCERKNKN
jgi:hypothetical protein